MSLTHTGNNNGYACQNAVSDEEDDDFLDDDPGLDMVYSEKLGVSLVHFIF